MPRKKHQPEETVAKLRQVDVLLSPGHPVSEAIRTISGTPLRMVVSDNGSEFTSNASSPGLAGSSREGGRNGTEGENPWPAAENAAFLTRFSTSFCLAPIPDGLRSRRRG